MVIYIPKENDFIDMYGVAKYYDSTYEYLKSCGIKYLEENIDKFSTITDVVILPF